MILLFMFIVSMKWDISSTPTVALVPAITYFKTLLSKYGALKYVYNCKDANNPNAEICPGLDLMIFKYFCAAIQNVV
jgi:hypothetical protein